MYFFRLSLWLCILFCNSVWAQEIYRFRETWAYLMKGEEQWLKGLEPISDLAYFGAAINELGRIPTAPCPTAIPEKVRAQKRIHLVIHTPSNRSLMYWCLSKDLETRQALIVDILRAAEPFDGLQIDFETIRTEDREAYWSFLVALKSGLPKGKIFSVAVPPRIKATEDAFQYDKIAAIADRVIVMAYDEHWRTGSPGTIASLSWCEKVSQFAQRMIPATKLIIGIPLFGRVWQKQEVARALKYFQTLDLWKQHKSPLERDPDGTAHFAYQETIDAVVYFENEQSLCQKLAYYQNAHIQSVGLWRISQEPSSLWQHLELVKEHIP